ncbi:33671_t:CDS:2, partial [Racocetra persica]
DDAEYQDDEYQDNEYQEEEEEPTSVRSRSSQTSVSSQGSQTSVNRATDPVDDEQSPPLPPLGTKPPPSQVRRALPDDRKITRDDSFDENDPYGSRRR